jgi:hypothetical protein
MLSFPTSVIIKIVSGLAVVAAMLYLLHLYGDARYNAGVADQKATDAAGVIAQYEANAKQLQGIYDNSVKSANGVDAASDATAQVLASIRSGFKGKTLTVIKEGVCKPSSDFSAQWNALSNPTTQQAK